MAVLFLHKCHLDTQYNTKVIKGKTDMDVAGVVKKAQKRADVDLYAVEGSGGEMPKDGKQPDEAISGLHTLRKLSAMW